MNDEPEVLYVLPTGDGGLPHYAAELANAVAERTAVSVLKPGETTADDFFEPNVETYDAFEPMDFSTVKLTSLDFDVVRNVKGVLSYANLRRIETIDPDVVHFTAPFEYFPHVRVATSLTRLDERYPVVETFHDVHPAGLHRRGGLFDRNEPFSNVILHNLKEILNVVLPDVEREHAIVHTRKNKRTLVENGARDENVTVIPHGTYQLFSRFEHDERTEPNTILFFGRVVGNKGPDVAVDAMARIREVLPDAKLIIAGDGTLPKSASELVSRYPDSFEVHNEFIPNEEVGRYFERSSVVAIPQRRQQGHSGTLTIAYDYGKPVVTSNVGEFPDLVRDEGCGLVVPTNDADALADALLTILQNATLRDAMERNAERMASELSWENVADDHVETYRELC